MKYFIALEEDLLMEIWRLDPTLVAPFSRPSVKTNDKKTSLVEPVETLSMKPRVLKQHPSTSPGSRNTRSLSLSKRSR